MAHLMNLDIVVKTMVIVTKTPGVHDLFNVEITLIVIFHHCSNL